MPTDEFDRRIAGRIALRVEYPGAEEVYIDVDVGTDLTRLELSLAQLFGSEVKRAERLWWRTPEGVMAPIAPENPTDPQPIGALLEHGALYSVILAADRPTIRGG